MTDFKASLEACPFCGGEAKLEQYRRDGLRISCKRCHVKLEERVMRYSLEWLEEEMVKAWNKRAMTDWRKSEGGK